MNPIKKLRNWIATPFVRFRNWIASLPTQYAKGAYYKERYNEPIEIKELPAEVKKGRFYKYGDIEFKGLFNGVVKSIGKVGSLHKRV